MDISAHWQNGQALKPTDRNKLESDIKNDLANCLGTGVKPCHSEPLVITLSVDGALLTEISGNVRCSCEKPLLAFRGDTSGSFTYEPVKA